MTTMSAVAGGPMVHGFALTGKYVVLFDRRSVAGLAQRAGVPPGHARRGRAIPGQPGALCHQRPGWQPATHGATSRRTAAQSEAEEVMDCCSRR
jgi:hypothetical protein